MSTRRIRPSALAIAKHCLRAPVLSALHNESHDVARFGSKVDQQVTAIITATMAGQIPELPGGEEPLAEADRCMEWLQATYPIAEWEWYPQRKVSLLDPETGEVLTEGTLDLLCRHRVLPKVAVVDWKKCAQRWGGGLPAPGENPQLLSYLAAAWLELSVVRPIASGQVVLAFWDEKGVDARPSEMLTETDLWKIIAEVKALPPFDLDQPLPEASVGDHCSHCWQRMHCDAWLIPAAALIHTGLAVPEFGTGGELTTEKVAKVLTWMDQASTTLNAAKRLFEIVKANVDAYTDMHGAVPVGELQYGPVPTKGSRSGATVATLEANHLEHLIRPGKPGVTHKWRKKT